MSRLSAALLLSLALVGCASVPMGDPKQDSAAKTFQVPADKAGIYVYRNETIGAAVKMDVIIDGQNIGETAAKTFFYKEVVPSLCVRVNAMMPESSLPRVRIHGESR